MSCFSLCQNKNVFRAQEQEHIHIAQDFTVAKYIILNLERFRLSSPLDFQGLTPAISNAPNWHLQIMRPRN